MSLRLRICIQNVRIGDRLRIPYTFRPAIGPDAIPRIYRGCAEITESTIITALTLDIAYLRFP